MAGAGGNAHYDDKMTTCAAEEVKQHPQKYLFLSLALSATKKTTKGDRQGMLKVINMP
jgi:hypothetical protein